MTVRYGGTDAEGCARDHRTGAQGDVGPALKLRALARRSASRHEEDDREFLKGGLSVAGREQIQNDHGQRGARGGRVPGRAPEDSRRGAGAGAELRGERAG